MQRTSLPGAFALGAVLVLAGCGGDGEPDASLFLDDPSLSAGSDSAAKANMVLAWVDGVPITGGDVARHIASISFSVVVP